jgi:hypothetical protein
MSDTLDNQNNNNQNNNQNNNANPNTDNTEGGAQVFSADYVKALRNESKNHRHKALSYGEALKKVLGVETLDDNLESAITTYQNKQQEAINNALSVANNRLIDAEFKALSGDYNEKLLKKVIDMADVKVDENGAVTGLKEAIEKAVEEFPEVKKNGSNPPKLAGGTGSGNPGGGLSGIEAAFLARNPGLKI